jgi:hypothetical protein
MMRKGLPLELEKHRNLKRTIEEEPQNIPLSLRGAKKKGPGVTFRGPEVTGFDGPLS